ncbi:MAG: hypothetical protein NXY57DRAFT_967878 [Lentinula lateritia]|nr:MAG: hypothetical protein NXY57DRAFT_967878 [Lentinula lateritia]
MSDSNSEAEIASMLDPTDVRDSDENSQDMPAAGSSTQIPRNGNNNWRGTNQYKHRPPIGDETVHQALLDYHHRNITDKRCQAHASGLHFAARYSEDLPLL